MDKNPEVLILAGSKSDIHIMIKAAQKLHEFKVQFELRICSAHRSPRTLKEIVNKFEERGGKIIIAGAGMAAHLPGVVASKTRLPVIGVPIYLENNSVGGLDALFSILQMPRGVPVATMAINGAENAALFALQILNLSYPEKIRYEEYLMKSRLDNINESGAVYTNDDFDKIKKI